MSPEQYTVQYNGRRYAVVLDTENAEKILRDAGRAIPAIPKGFNTHWEIFHTVEGQLAAFLQQIGFEERETDMGREVNGALVYICLDDQSVEELDQFVEVRLGPD